jgi:hypothetical protein
MASNRSRTRERSAAPAETPSLALNALAIRAAHIQIAACVAAAAMTAFPRAAADHFDTRVARVSTDN